ncbi:MAG: MFS transporter [Candidatus Helarchaeota archaeon]
MVEEKHPFVEKFSYSIGQFADTVAYQGFTYLIFTFYFAVVKLPVDWITWGFIFWSIWNALNDPLVGILSDRTKTRWGKRKPWIMFSTIPLALIMFFLFTPPMPNDQVAKFIYFVLIIMAFDGIYTAMSLNHTSLFPEMYIDDKSRASVSSMRRILTVVGLIFAFVLPTLFIVDLTNQFNYPFTLSQFQITGAALGITVLVGLLILLKWGIKEKKEFQSDALKTPNVFKAFKYTLKNKSFLFYVVAGLMTWYVFGLLPTIVPFYGTYVLNIEKQSILLSLLLLVAFLMAIPGILLWKWIGRKIGVKKGYMISLIGWACALSPFYFISDFVSGIIVMVFVGLGLAGSLYYIDLIISDIIDEDELKTGVRREGGYYGINALVIRLSTILTFVTIGLVLNTTGWYVYDPGAYSFEIEMGLRSLMFIFPAIALLIGALSMHFYPLHGKRLEEQKAAREKLHSEKRAALNP